jgi:hypothetical protein
MPSPYEPEGPQGLGAHKLSFGGAGVNPPLLSDHDDESVPRASCSACGDGRRSPEHGDVGLTDASMFVKWSWRSVFE